MKLVTKKFLDGNLKGLEYQFKTYHGFELGKIYSDCVTGKRYQIVKVEVVTVHA